MLNLGAVGRGLCALHCVTSKARPEPWQLSPLRQLQTANVRVAVAHPVWVGVPEDRIANPFADSATDREGTGGLSKRVQMDDPSGAVLLLDAGGSQVGEELLATWRARENRPRFPSAQRAVPREMAGEHRMDRHDSGGSVFGRIRPNQDSGLFRLRQIYILPHKRRYFPHPGPRIEESQIEQRTPSSESEERTEFVVIERAIRPDFAATATDQIELGQRTALQPINLDQPIEESPD